MVPTPNTFELLILGLWEVQATNSEPTNLISSFLFFRMESFCV